MAAKLNIRLSPQQQRLLAAGALFLGGGGFAYIKWFWLPINVRIKEAKTKIEEVEGKITKAKGQAARLPKIQQELALLNQQALDTERRLPKVKDVPAVIDTLERLTRKHRVELGSFSPGAPSPKTYFIEVPYALSITGAYHDVGRFLAAVAIEDRIYNVRNVNFSGGSGDAEGKVSVSFTLISYQYKG